MAGAPGRRRPPPPPPPPPSTRARPPPPGSAGGVSTPPPPPPPPPPPAQRQFRPLGAWAIQLRQQYRDSRARPARPSVKGVSEADSREHRRLLLVEVVLRQIAGSAEQIFDKVRRADMSRDEAEGLLSLFSDVWQAEDTQLFQGACPPTCERRSFETMKLLHGMPEQLAVRTLRCVAIAADSDYRIRRVQRFQRELDQHVVDISVIMRSRRVINDIIWYLSLANHAVLHDADVVDASSVKRIPVTNLQLCWLRISSTTGESFLQAVIERLPHFAPELKTAVSGELVEALDRGSKFDFFGVNQILTDAMREWEQLRAEKNARRRAEMPVAPFEAAVDLMNAAELMHLLSEVQSIRGQVEHKFGASISDMQALAELLQRWKDVCDPPPPTVPAHLAAFPC